MAMVYRTSVGHNSPSTPKFQHVSFHVSNFRNDRDLDLSTLYNNANEVDYDHTNSEEGFRWANRGVEGSVPHTVPSRDDGVVLLVGLFNLLAIVVYAAQLTLAKKPIRDEGRVINWQVQKVLDELVLRVHSSTTASNLLARSLNFEPQYTSSRSPFFGRSVKSKITPSAFIRKKLQEGDPVKLKKWLNAAGGQLLKSISSSPVVKRGPRIDPKIYLPLIKFYTKMTQTSRRGRAFETSLLQEIGAVAATASEMNLKEARQLLKTIIKIGRIQRSLDARPFLEGLLPSPSLPDKRSGSSPKVSNVVRMKREVQVPPEVKASPYQQREEKSDARETMLPATIVGKSKVSSRHRGLPSHSSSLRKNWADGWFYLMTQAAPLGLDVTTLYANAHQRPECSQGQLCAANNFWRRRGHLHAALTPFLSVMVSWALEYSGGKTLGDSLIAIRAGWMGKDCRALYPQCLVNNTPHPLAKQAAELLSNEITPEGKQRTSETRHQGIHHQLQPRDSHNYTQASQESQIVTHNHSLELADQTLNESHQKVSQTPAKEPLKEPIPESQHEQEAAVTQPPPPPYERYDTPVQEGKVVELPSGSVAGMDIQDAQDLYSSPAELGEAISLPEYGPQEFDRSQIYQMNQQDMHKVDHKKTWNKETIMHHVPSPPSYTSIKRSDQPPLLNIPGYSSYMAYQKPASVNNQQPPSPKRKPITHQSKGHKKDLVISHKDNVQHSSKTRKGPVFYIHNKTERKQLTYDKLKKEMQKKYRYGLRRGLPASNVNGYSPLMASANEIKRKGELRKTHPRERTPYSRHSTLPDKPISKFQPKDAITDVFRNKILYQYIRDRQMRRLPRRV